MSAGLSTNIPSFLILTVLASVNLFSQIGDLKFLRFTNTFPFIASDIGEIYKQSPVDFILVATLYSIIFLLLLLIPITRGKIFKLLGIALGGSFVMTGIIAFIGIAYFAYKLISDKNPSLKILNIVSLGVSIVAAIVYIVLLFLF